MATKEYLGINIDYDRDKNFSESGLNRLKEGYMLKSESSPQERFAFVANAFSSNKDHAQRMYDYMSNFWLSCSTPILSYGTSKKSLPISCFASYLDDTIESIFSVSNETRTMAVSGGGVGVHVNLRPGDKKSSGIIPHLRTYDADVSAFKQNSSRRGATAVYLAINHPEIHEFIEMRKPTGGDENRKCLNIHHAVNLPDEFMHRIYELSTNDKLTDEQKQELDRYDLINPNTNEVATTVSARDLWSRLIMTRMETGEPYCHFIDHANASLPDYQKEQGLEINGSNLCVAPETLILTDKGYIPIQTLRNQSVNIWNGFEWSNVTVEKTGTSQEIIKIVTDSGQELNCTKYHKFYIQNGYNKNHYEKIEARDLKPGMAIIKFNMPVIECSDDFIKLDKPYINGFFTGDGCDTKEGQRIYLYGEKIKLKDEFYDCGKWIDEEIKYNRIYTHYKNLKYKYFVPDVNYSIDDRLEWLAGLSDADGCIYRNGYNQQLVISSTNKEFIIKLSLMLNTLGCNPKVKLALEAGKRLLPLHNANDDYDYFDCEDLYRLIIQSTDLQKLINMGINFRRLSVMSHTPDRDARKYIRIKEVIDENRIDDTYCCYEAKRNMVVFNGILTGNCIEMALATNPTRSLVCCLASINLEKYDEIKPHIKKFISDVVEFLDNVLQVFIDKTKDIPEFDKARNCAINERPLGIGALGWHSYLQSKNIPIESVMAVSINNSIWSEIKANAVEASERLAEERGCIPDILNSKIPNLKPRRNSHLLALAPNAASSYILNTSPSCEPYRACFYAEKGTNGLVIHKNKYLDKIIREKEGVDYDDVWREIIAAEGILKNIDCLTDLEKDVFKSFPEIAQEWIIELAADRQKYICQGQSTNLAFFPTEHVAVVHNIHLLAWKKGLKGLYYCRSDSLRKADKVGQKVIREKIESLEELNKQEEVCLACQ